MGEEAERKELERKEKEREGIEQEMVRSKVWGERRKRKKVHCS